MYDFNKKPNKETWLNMLECKPDKKVVQYYTEQIIVMTTMPGSGKRENRTAGVDIFKFIISLSTTNAIRICCARVQFPQLQSLHKHTLTRRKKKIKKKHGKLEDKI